MYIFIISRSFLLRMRTVSDKLCTENQNTHFVLSNLFFNPLNAKLNAVCHLLALLAAHPILHVSRIRVNRGVYELMWKHIVERSRPQMAIWHKLIACWIPKATNTHTKVVQYSLLAHCNNGCTNAPKCSVYCLSWYY